MRHHQVEGGILGGSTNEEDALVLDCREENVQLSSAKAMDLFQEQHCHHRQRASEDLYPFSGFLDGISHVLDSCNYC